MRHKDFGTSTFNLETLNSQVEASIISDFVAWYTKSAGLHTSCISICVSVYISPFILPLLLHTTPLYSFSHAVHYVRAPSVVGHVNRSGLTMGASSPRGPWIPAATSHHSYCMGTSATKSVCHMAHTISCTGWTFGSIIQYS